VVLRLPAHLAAAHDDLVRAAARTTEIVTDAA
jgi:hypothetical protein